MKKDHFEVPSLSLKGGNSQVEGGGDLSSTLFTLLLLRCPSFVVLAFTLKEEEQSQTNACDLNCNLIFGITEHVWQADFRISAIVRKVFSGELTQAQHLNFSHFFPP